MSRTYRKAKAFVHAKRYKFPRAAIIRSNAYVEEMQEEGFSRFIRSRDVVCVAEHKWIRTINSAKNGEMAWIERVVGNSLDYSRLRLRKDYEYEILYDGIMNLLQAGIPITPFVQEYRAYSLRRNASLNICKPSRKLYGRGSAEEQPGAVKEEFQVLQGYKE